MRDLEDNSPLCCCEYRDIHGERNHLLACCCNCQPVDECCERLITCRGLPRRLLRTIMVSCLDRLRCPHRGGARKITLDMLPFLVQPLLVRLAVHSYATLVIVLCLIPSFLLFSSFYFTKIHSYSLFFYNWTIASVFYVVFVYEFLVVPMLEIYPQENITLVIFTLISVCFFYLSKQNSNHIHHFLELRNGEILSNGSAHESICPVCRIKVYPRSFHCHICQTCVPKFDHHCLWLNCCVGEHNQHVFILGLVFALCALVFGSMIILTSVCRPVFYLGVLVPEDCCDILDDTLLGMCFVTAVYCLEVAVFIFIILAHHLWLISRGFSGLEWRKQTSFSVCASSPYSQGFLSNWVQTIKNLRKIYL